MFHIDNCGELISLLETSQGEITRAGGQMEPPGMRMIYLPYSDDIRDSEEARKYSWVYAKRFSSHFITDKFGDVSQIFPDTEDDALRADEDQIQKAAALIKRIDMKDFSVCQFANPGKLFSYTYAL